VEAALVFFVKLAGEVYELQGWEPPIVLAAAIETRPDQLPWSKRQATRPGAAGETPESGQAGTGPIAGIDSSGDLSSHLATTRKP
jgi:hypothetical protein